jgi:hypothetical protein
MIVKMYREIQKTQAFQYFVDSVDLCEPKRIAAHALILLNDQR